MLSVLLTVFAPRLAQLASARGERQRIVRAVLRARTVLNASKTGYVRRDASREPLLLRLPDKAETNALSKRAGGQSTLRPLEGARLPADFQAARRVLSKSKPDEIHTLALDEERTAGYTVLRDARGQAAYLLRVETPREGYAQIRRALGFAALGLGAGGLYCVAVILLRSGVSVFAAPEADEADVVAAGAAPLAQPGAAMGDALFHARREAEDWASDEITRMKAELEVARGKLRESEETYRQMALNASDVLYAMYPGAGRIEWLGQIDLMLGYQHGSFPRTIEAWADSIHPDEAPGIIALYTKASERGETFAVEYRMRHRNGSYRDWSHKGKPVYGPDKKLLKLVGACTDITEKKRAQSRLRESEERLARIVETSASAIVMCDREGHITFANPAAELIFGADRSDITGRNYADPRWNITASDGTPLPAAEMPFARAGQSGEAVHNIEHMLQHASGLCVVVSVNGAPLRDASGEMTGSVLSITDITGRKALEDRLAFQAFHDPLTKLPNRALFVDRLGHALTRCQRSKTMVAVFFIDLDNFKTTNDTLGHDAGDELLITTAGRVTCALRAGDTAARLGGDEFTIMLDNITEMSQALTVAERVLKALLQPVTLKGQEVYAPPSIGVALGNHDDTSDTLMARADAAMYQAKKNGKARYEVAPIGL